MKKTKIKQDKQRAILHVPVTMCNSIWKGDFEKLPPNETYELKIDYPLTHPARFNIKTGAKGMNIIQLIKKIGELYEMIYEAEPDNDEPCDEDEDVLYGIYGHGIDDLSLSGINVNHTTKKITLDVGS
jgi:hypothetical protein